MKTSRGKGAKAKATTLHSIYVRLRDGCCQNCGRFEPLDCAHIFTRGRNATRTDEHNAVALCKGCHLRFTVNPFDWVDWCIARLGEDEVARLRAKSTDSSFKASEAFWRSEVERLTALIAEVEP